MRDDTNTVCFVAYLDNSAAGVVVCSRYDNAVPVCYETRHLYVEPRFRGHKIAQVLIKACLDWAGDDDAEATIVTRDLPRAYYRALGFEPTHQICTASLKTVRERLGG